MIMKNLLLSVIVPTKNSEVTIEACLKSIKSQSYKNIEIIVVDNNSTDRTKEIAKRFTELVFNKGPERSAQRNFGASKSKGEYLLFIDSDMILENKVVEECVNKFKIHPFDKLRTKFKIGGVIIPEVSFGKGFWARCKALERSFYLGVDWMEAPRFFPKSVFAELKGFDEKLISGEDWDLNQKIKTKYNIARIKSFIRHDEGNLSLMKSLSKKMYYGAKLRNYSSKKENSTNFKEQSSIIKRYKLFLSDPKKLFSNPIVGVGMLFMKTCEFISMASGYVLKS
jgi:glycosyltransferase involved in cell wall biosynthesis